MTSLVLLRPYWLFILPLLFGLAVWTRRRKAHGGWATVIDPAILPALRKLGLVVDGRGSRYALLPWIAAAMTAIALSGPAIQRPGSVGLRALDPLILILDLSPSVVADVRVLGALQAAAAELLTLAEARPVGMMVYAADAYLASAPTTDARSLQGLIAVLTRDTIPVAGSRPDIALSMARDLFSAGETGIGGADLVLISDGGGTGPIATEEAVRLASDGARLWALQLTENAEGAPPVATAGLAELAEAGSGAALEVSETQLLMEKIAAARTARLVRDETSARAMQDLGPWVLVLAALIMLPLFRRRQ